MNYVVEQKTHVVMERPEPTYYAKIPKMAQLELDPYELALYTNYKQTASDNPNGAAWKSNETLAKECHMSPRKISSVRQSLVKKGYIHCTYETSESGKEYSSAIVTIVDIWALNHERFSSPTLAPHANPPLHEVLTPLAPHANKEELNNKNQEKNKEIAPKVAKPYYDMIASILDVHGGRNADIQKMLEGKATKKQYAECNLNPPMDLAEFTAWGQWAKQALGQYIPKSAANLQSSIISWRQKQSKQSPKLQAVATMIFTENNLATDGVVTFEKNGK